MLVCFNAQPEYMCLILEHAATLQSKVPPNSSFTLVHLKSKKQQALPLCNRLQLSMFHSALQAKIPNNGNPSFGLWQDLNWWK